MSYTYLEKFIDNIVAPFFLQLSIVNVPQPFHSVYSYCRIFLKYDNILYFHYHLVAYDADTQFIELNQNF